MKQFYDFLDSIKHANPTLIEGIIGAYKIITEGLQTDEVLADADMKLEQNTEDKIAEDEPMVDDMEFSSMDDSYDISTGDTPVDDFDEFDDFDDDMEIDLDIDGFE